MIEFFTYAFDGVIAENALAMFRMAIGYYLLLVLLPSVCLKRYVADRDLAYRVVFYQVWGFLYLIAWSFVLSYAHLYLAPVLWIVLVFLPLGITAGLEQDRILARYRKSKAFWQAVSRGEYNLRRATISSGQWIKVRAVGFYNAYLKGHLLTLVFGCFAAAFAVALFGYFKLHYSSYAYTDEETHLYWIQYLVNNSAFPAGLYPHGEHFLVGAIVTLLGAQVPRNWLCFSAVSLLVILQAAYLFGRKVFSSRAAMLFALCIFLFAPFTHIAAYYRFQYSVPMEFALMAMFLCLFALMSFLEDKSRMSMLLFGAGFALTFQIHFYVTIFTTILLVGFAVVYVIPAARRKILHKIILSAFLSIVISIIPFGVGLLCGYSFERSIDWAIEISQGGDGSESLNTDSDTEEEEAEEEEVEEEEVEEEEDPEQELIDATAAELKSVSNPQEALDFAAKILTYSFALTSGIAYTLIALVLICCAYGALGCIWFAARRKEGIERYQAVLAIGITWLFGFALYGAYYIGLPEIIHIARVNVFLGIYTMFLFAVPLQILSDLLALIPVKRQRMDVVLCALAVCGLGYYVQNYPMKSVATLHYNFAIQDADMRLCQDLLDNYDNNSWTVISPVNDLSTIRNYGYHYEIIDLLQEIEDGEEEIYIPTRDIFVVVEDEIWTNGDVFFVDGSDTDEHKAEVDPYLAAVPLSELGVDELATKDRAYYELRQYTMSKLWYWMEEIKAVYPEEVSVYYQDEFCTVYHIQQDPYFTLNLSVDYSGQVEDAIKKKEKEAAKQAAAEAAAAEKASNSKKSSKKKADANAADDSKTDDTKTTE